MFLAIAVDGITLILHDICVDLRRCSEGTAKEGRYTISALKNS